MKDIKKIEKELKFASEIPSYEPWSILVRFTIVTVIAIIVLKLIVHVASFDKRAVSLEGPCLSDYFLIIFMFNLMSELQIIVDNILERFLPIPEEIKKRFLTQTILSIILIFGVFNFTTSISSDQRIDEITRTPYYFGVALGLVFVTFLSTLLLLIRLMEKWVFAQQRIDEMKQDKLRMDYSALQDQLNPHFLFNNLSVLKSLIIYNKDLALNFTENITDVYRYVLQSKDKILVSFRKEQEFINSFIALHKERLGEGLEVKFSIEKAALNKEIAPLTLQLLVENAIKHNIASKDIPLTIEISTENEFLIVENKMQLRETSYSTKTGLNNLIKRYRMLTDIEIQISDRHDTFIVKVPLL